MDFQVKLIRKSVRHALLCGSIVIAMSTCLSAESPRSRLERSEKSLKALIDEYHQWVLTEEKQQQKKLEPQVKSAIRKHLEMADEINAQRIVESRRKLDVVEQRLKEAKQRIDRRVEAEWESRRVPSIPAALVPEPSSSPIENVDTKRLPSFPNQLSSAESGNTDTMLSAADDLASRLTAARFSLEAAKQRIADVEHSARDKQDRIQIEKRMRLEVEQSNQRIKQVKKYQETMLALLKVRLSTAKHELDIARAEVASAKELRKQQAITQAELAKSESQAMKAENALLEQELLYNYYRELDTKNEPEK